MGERTVSMYSPRAALFGGMLKSTTTSHASRCKQESTSQVSVQLFHTLYNRVQQTRVSKREVYRGNPTYVPLISLLLLWPLFS
jgi:hypothetical protein